MGQLDWIGGSNIYKCYVMKSKVYYRVDFGW